MLFRKPPPPGRPPTIMRPSYIKVGIKTKAAQTSPGGGLTWAVIFELEREAEADGFLIQEIHIQSWTLAREVRDRVKGYIEKRRSEDEWDRIAMPEIHYWEAWPVKKGSKYIDWGNRITSHDDEYEISGDIETRGISQVGGWIRHYYGALPGSFRAFSTQAQALPSTTFCPVFWSRHLATAHHVECHWNKKVGRYEFEFGSEKRTIRTK